MGKADNIMDLKSSIIDKYNELSTSNKKVADYFLERWETVAFNTLGEMSKRIGVSTTTIIRFSRELGYDGYSAIQQEVQNSIKNQASLPRRLELTLENNIPEDQLLQESFKCDILNLSHTVESLSVDMLKKAVDMISNAPNVYIMGLRATFSVAHYTSVRLAQVRENVHFLSGLGNVYPEELVSICKGDVCLIYLFPRYSRIVIDAIKWMKKQGVFVVLITSPSYQPLEQYADVVLSCWTQALSLKSSLVAPMCLSQYIISAVTIANNDVSKRTLEKVEEIISQGGYFVL